MDALESVGRNQYNKNLTLIENYEMIKGRFIFSHYFSEEGYQGMLQQLTKEFEMPNYLRHYDIISKVVNKMVAEWQSRPDIFRVKAEDEGSTNEFLRQKTDLLKQYVQENIQAEISKKLEEQGLAPEMQNFKSEDDKAKYQQQVDSVSKAMTPPQIEKYMSVDFRTSAEMWGQIQLESDKQRFDLKEKEKKEFEDMLVADRCFRHFFLTPTGYDQETWNPINTFYHKSPDIDYTEDGDYIGRVYILTLPAIIDKFGHRMKKDQLEQLIEESKKNKQQWSGESKGSEYVYKEYLFPFKGFPAYDIARNTTSNPFDNNGASIPYLDSNFFSGMSSGRMYNAGNGYYWVTEAYWKSQHKIGLVTYIDPDTEIKVSKLVDEHFIIPKHFIELTEDTLSGDHEPNTIVWTWINQVYGGVKVNLGNRDQSVYLGADDSTKPSPVKFQFKGENNIYGAKLPVCGRLFSVRNSMSMSLVDLMKPYQIGYNVSMNQLYQLMEKEIGSFVVMDVNMFPNSKDWGGADSWQKWMLIAKSMGMLPADTSPQNSKNSAAAAGGQFPKVLNLDSAAQFMSRMNIANAFEQKALTQVGFNDYSMGTYGNEATATGIQQGAQSSKLQTESYFINFSNYLKRCYKMNLDIAQYVQSKNKDVTATYIKSDLSRAYVKVAGADLMLADLGCYVENSQEVVRQLEMLRQLAMSNNTTGATAADLADIITMNSPSEIKAQLKLSQSKLEALQERQQQVNEQTLQQQKELAQLKEEKTDERENAKLQNNIDVALIAAHSKSTQPTTDTSGIDQANIDLKNQQLANDITDKQRKHQLELDKAISEKELKIKELALESKAIDGKLKVEDKKIQVAKIMKSKENNKSKK